MTEVNPPTTEAAARGIAHADYVAGLAKGLAVLESFDTERQRLNATQAAQRAGLTRAAARRHLLTLAELGYLESRDGHFWLSPRVLRLAGAYLASARLPRVVQPTLNRLAADTQDAYSVAVLDGDEVVIVAQGAHPALAGRLLAYGRHLGARLPAHATSTGRVLLAALPPAALGAWLRGRTLARLTPNTLTDTRRLRSALDAVIEQDHCQAVEEHELGVAALAVPLRTGQGATVAALNVILGPDRLAAPGVAAATLARLKAAARELRELL